MSITRTERVDCECGTPVEVFLADSLNAGRHPHLKQALLDRQLHVYRCSVCDRAFVIEKDMMYLDFERKQYFCVYPRHERAREQECSAHVKRAYESWMRDSAPQFIQDYGKDFLVRVCFGYEELREKIVIDDAGLSDLVIEALKIDILTADPWFEHNNVVTLRLDRLLDDGTLRFLPEWLAVPATETGRVVDVRRAVYDEIDDRFDDILKRHPGLALGAHVSLLRLVSWPEVPPLGRVQRIG